MTIAFSFEDLAFMGILQPPIISDGLVLHLDAGNPLSYPGSGTTWTDLSGRSNNGTLVNGVGFNSENGGALVFDGVDDYCRIAVPGLNNNEFSGDCFVMPSMASSLNDLETIVSKFYGNNVWNFRLSIGNFFIGNDTSIRFNVRPAPDFSEGVSGPQLNLSQWYHVAFSAKELDSISLYLNGHLLETITPTLAMPPSVTSNIYIGSSDPALDSPRFYGGMRLANLRLYNKRLTSQEVQQNFNALRGRYEI